MGASKPPFVTVAEMLQAGQSVCVAKIVVGVGLDIGCDEIVVELVSKMFNKETSITLLSVVVYNVAAVRKILST